MPELFGRGANQAPLNHMLGAAAFRRCEDFAAGAPGGEFAVGNSGAACEIVWGRRLTNAELQTLSAQ